VIINQKIKENIDLFNRLNRQPMVKGITIFYKKKTKIQFMRSNKCPTLDNKIRDTIAICFPKNIPSEKLVYYYFVVGQTSD